MTTPIPPSASAPAGCPMHGTARVSPTLQPPGAWPPGPPPGLTGWGLLRAMAGDLLGTLAQWQRDYGDLVHLRIWPEHQIVVSDPGLVRELLTGHHDSLVRWERGIAVFSRIHGNGVFIAEGEAWRAKRRALQPSFAARSMEDFAPTIAAATDTALARWPRSGEAGAAFPVESAFTALAMDVIMRLLFSSPIGEEARQAEQAVHDVIGAANGELYWPASWPDFMPWKGAKRRGLKVLDRLIGRHLQQRLAQPAEDWPEDLLTRLLRLHRQDGAAWPLAAVRDECMTAFLAGHESTAAALTWWAWCMADNPAAQETARREVQVQLEQRRPGGEDLPALPYLTQTLLETLRLYPPAPLLLGRRAKRPITLGGWTFPERTLFLVPLQLMHHDPRCFPEPLEFHPERFAGAGPEAPRGAFMPFGTGPRVCLGQHLALTEMTVAAAMVLQRYRLAVPPGALAPRPRLRVSLRPEQPLQLSLYPLAAG